MLVTHVARAALISQLNGLLALVMIVRAYANVQIAFKGLFKRERILCQKYSHENTMRELRSNNSKKSSGVPCTKTLRAEASSTHMSAKSLFDGREARLCATRKNIQALIQAAKTQGSATQPDASRLHL